MITNSLLYNYLWDNMINSNKLFNKYSNDKYILLDKIEKCEYYKNLENFYDKIIIKIEKDKVKIKSIPHTSKKVEKQRVSFLDYSDDGKDFIRFNGLEINL